MTTVAEKYDELTRYLRKLAYQANVYETAHEDITASVIERLLVEEQSSPFPTARALWGRATNVMREEIAKAFAAALPLSGVGPTANRFAHKYLSENDGDPDKAYANQTSTTKVGLDLLRLVAGGTGQSDHQALELHSTTSASEVSSLSEEVEDEIHRAVRELDPDRSRVVSLYLGFDGGPMPLSQVAEELGFTLSKTKALWASAKTLLSDKLSCLI